MQGASSYTKSKIAARVYEQTHWGQIDYSTIYHAVVRPALWKDACTILALVLALKKNTSVACLDGGLHHAKRFTGGGFCLFSDIAVAIEKARKNQLLEPADPVLYLDTDAHLGNGVWIYTETIRRFICSTYSWTQVTRNISV